MATHNTETLIYVQDLPNRTSVRVGRGVPVREEKSFWHDDDFAYTRALHDKVSEKHKQALRDAAAYGRQLAEQYHTKCETNF